LVVVWDKMGFLELVLIGLVSVEGCLLVVVVGEFGFFGGSIGVVIGEWVAWVIECVIECWLLVLVLFVFGGIWM